MLCLYRVGYDFKRLFSISEYYDRDRPAFYRAIQSVRERDMVITGWLEYFVQGLATQLREVKERGKKVIKADLAIREHGLNDRQAHSLRLLIGQDVLRTPELETLYPEVTRRTLQRDLRMLEQLGLVERRGAARAASYALKEERI